MAKFANRIKLAWLKGVEVLGNSASNLASNAKFKVAEINLETRRREIMTEFNLKAFEMWQSGVSLPPPLDSMLQEYSELGERLSLLRAQQYASVGNETEEDKEKSEGDIEQESLEAVSEAASEKQATEAEVNTPAHEHSEPPSDPEAQTQSRDFAEYENEGKESNG